MGNEYHLSAGALLYAAIRLEKQQFLGVKNVLETLTEETLPRFVQQAEDELLTQNCASLHFDGSFVLDEAFAALIDRCCSCDAVLAVSRRLAQKQDTLVVYPAAGCAALTQTGEEYLLAEGSGDAAQPVLAFLQLPAQPNTLPAILLDSILIEEQDTQGLLDAGCTNAMAELIVQSARGVGGYASLSRAGLQGPLDESVLVYGDAGLFTVDVEYTETQELFRFSPVDADWITRRTQTLVQP